MFFIYHNIAKGFTQYMGFSEDFREMVDVQNCSLYHLPNKKDLSHTDWCGIGLLLFRFSLKFLLLHDLWQLLLRKLFLPSGHFHLFFMQAF